jgi:outer membrane protein assembly factor BamB
VAGIAIQGSSCIGTVAALDPATGDPIWQVPVGGVVQGAVTEVPGVIAVGAGRYLQILSSATGTSLFSFRESSGHNTKNGQGQNYYFWPPPTIVGNNLFIGNEDGNFRAFGV